MADKNFIVKNGLEVGGQEVVSSSGVVTSAALGGQTLASTDSPTFNNLTLTNDIAVGGDLNLTGDLNITGDVNSLSVTDLDVTDQTITLGAGQVESASGGSGIVVDGSGASILWDETNDEWDFNKDINVTGTISSGAITSTGAIKTDYSDEISMDYTPNLGAYYKGMSGRNQSSSTARGLHIFNYDNDSNEGINFWVGTNSSKVFAARINSSGNVGIGETDPNAQLHIGSSNATGDATNPALQIGGANTYRLGMYTDNETAYIENKNGDDGIAFRVKTAGEAMRIDGGTGNVGIGTTSPASFLTNATALEISGGTGVGSELILTNNSSMSANEVVGSLIFKNTDPSGAPNHFAGLRARAESTFGRMDLEFYAGRSRMEGGTPDMVIIPNGADAQANVGIGTDLPSSKLHISGINTTGGLFVEDSSASAASPPSCCPPSRPFLMSIFFE